jgi:2-amino-4-hydroxy-6-hydroxymethyldihydropteridine diphosphokinase
MPTCLIALGCNLGDCQRHLSRALAALDQLPQTRVTRASSWLANRPVGGPPGQGVFLNAAARVETELAARDLLSECLRIETAVGRVRRERWAARPLDLDILLYGERIMETPDLVVPHPWLAVRRFVLEPAAEVAADLRHPVIGWTLGELWQHLTTAAPYFAVIGEDSRRVWEVLLDTAQRQTVYLLPSRGTNAAGNLAGRLPVGEIEFWRRMADELAEAFAEEPHRPVLGDFWWPLQRPRWDDSGQPPPGVDFPLCKLLVILTGRPPADVAERATLPTLWHQCRQLRKGPLLELDSNDHDRLVHDLIAAMESMQ